MDRLNNKIPSPERGREARASHWSRDYVEHLRTIHFSLILLSMAAIVIGSAGSPNEITEARKQINAILGVVHKWDEDWIKSGAQRALSSYSHDKRRVPSLTAEEIGRFQLLPQGANTITVRWPGGPQSYKVSFAEPNWIVLGPLRDFLDDRQNSSASKRGDDGPAPPLPKPKKLIEFRELWDVLNKRHVVEVPKLLMTEAYFATDSDTPPGVATTWDVLKVSFNWLMREDRTIFDAHSFNLVTIPVVLRQYFSSNSQYVYEAYLPRDGESRPFVFMIPIDHSAPVDFDAQDVLVEQFDVYKPPSGLFEHSFPELSRITKNYQSLELDQFDPILEAEEGRTAESLEAFGVKFPAEATTRWGVLLILGVQIYFWIHLQELSRKLAPDDPGWEVAYIGMYHSFPSRLVYSISIVAVPVGAVLTLGIRGLHVGHNNWLYWLYLIFGTMLSLILAYMAWRAAPERRPGRMTAD